VILMLINRAHFPFTHLSLPDLLRVAGTIVDKAKKSAVLPAGDTYLSELTVNRQSFADAEQTVLTLKRELVAAINVRRDKEMLFRKTCLAFAGHVNDIARGDASVITAVGLEVQKTARSGAAPTVMIAPLHVRAAPGPKPGEVRLSWKRVKGAKSYALQRSQDSTQGFVAVEIVTTRSVLLPAQPSATPLWYRLAAIGPSGQGPWTDPIPVVAH